MMALEIPVEEIGGDQQVVGVYATTSRRRFKVLAEARRRRSPSANGFRSAARATRCSTKALVAIEDKDLYSRTQPPSDKAFFRKYAQKPELAKLINAVSSPTRTSRASRPTAPTSPGSTFPI